MFGLRDILDKIGLSTAKRRARDMVLALRFAVPKTFMNSSCWRRPAIKYFVLGQARGVLSEEKKNRTPD